MTALDQPASLTDLVFKLAMHEANKPQRWHVQRIGYSSASAHPETRYTTMLDLPSGSLQVCVGYTYAKFGGKYPKSNPFLYASLNGQPLPIEQPRDVAILYGILKTNVGEVPAPIWGDVVERLSANIEEKLRE